MSVLVGQLKKSAEKDGEELQRAQREERNRRAFEGWLSRKNEERKVLLLAKCYV